jgi:molecular chaperone GrpE (heat shock protein)
MTMENEKETEQEELEVEIEEPKNEEPEVVDEQPKQEATPKEEDEDYSQRVQRRINKLVQQRKESDAKAEEKEQELNALKQRLERLEQGETQKAQKQFEDRYVSVKQEMQKAIEEGDTGKQVEYAEQLADIRAAMKVAELQRQQVIQQKTQSPTVGRAAQPSAPKKAMDWWGKNQWFNSPGYERETAAARSIDVQLDLEGYDKESDQYYETLNNRLQKIFPELISKPDMPVKTRPKSSQTIVAPSAGGSTKTGNRVKMTKEQLRMAREIGLTTPEQIKAYAEEIKKQERT